MTVKTGKDGLWNCAETKLIWENSIATYPLDETIENLFTTDLSTESFCVIGNWQVF